MFHDYVNSRNNNNNDSDYKPTEVHDNEKKQARESTHTEMTTNKTKEVQIINEKLQRRKNDIVQKEQIKV
jgi:hypothetical protein